MRNYWIFPALMSVTLSFFFFTEQGIICSLIIIVGIIRLLFLKKRIVMICSLSVLILFGIYFLNVKQSISEPKLLSTVKTLIIFPDEMKINGDQVSGSAKANGQPVRFTYKLHTPNEKNIWSTVDRPIQVQVESSESRLIEGARNPGEFDFKRFSNQHYIFQTIKINQTGTIENYVSTNLLDTIHFFRIKFLNYLSQLPKWPAVHAKSLLVGYSDNDESDLFKILSVLGIIHLFSLSGMHVVILVLFIKKLTSLLFITSELTESVLLFILPMYGVFVGLKTGIIRAIILVMITILLRKLRIKMGILDIFSLTVLVCLLIEPFSMITMGGQLSFLLSASLIFLLDSTSIITTIKLNLISLPIICYYSFQFSWLILIMNIVFVPIFIYLILPTSIVSAIFPQTMNFIWIHLDHFFDKLYSQLDLLAAQKELNFVVGRFPIILILILIFLGLLNLERKGLNNRYTYLFILSFIIGILYLRVPLWGSVSIIDIGQGDSILVTTPFRRKTILIDTGGRLQFPVKPWQEKKPSSQIDWTTIPYLKSRGIDQIDTVFLSHKDVDHIGNLDELLDKLPVKEVCFGAGLDQNKRIKNIIKRHPKTTFSSLRRGDSFKVAQTQWKVLWPNKRSVGENGDSLTLLAQIGQRKWLFTGDLDIENEDKILAIQSFKVDFLKAGHHGSKTSTGNNWLKTIEPMIAFISAGVNNRYGHPNKETSD